ncbi:MAG: hypothetical protein IJX37_10390 [Oscillospiraceae bacterium]|nr:hypothetical protein [Oscillospiraceae bacterium]
MEKNKKLLLLIAAGVVFVILVCVLVACLLSGAGQQNGDSSFEGSAGVTTSGNEETAEDVLNATGDDATADNTTGEETGNGGNGNNGNGNNGNGGNGNGGSNESVPQQPSIGVEIDDPTEGSGDEEAGDTKPSDNAVIDFDDLLAGIEGNG